MSAIYLPLPPPLGLVIHKAADMALARLSQEVAWGRWSVEVDWWEPSGDGPEVEFFFWVFKQPTCRDFRG